MGASIAAMAEEALQMALPNRPANAVVLVWDPPWDPGMITPEGRRCLRDS